MNVGMAMLMTLLGMAGSLVAWVAWDSFNGEATKRKSAPSGRSAQHAPPMADSGPYRTAAPGGKAPSGDGFREWAEYHNGPPGPDSGFAYGSVAYGDVTHTVVSPVPVFDPAYYKAARAELVAVAESWGNRYNDTTGPSDQKKFALQQYDQSVRDLALLDERWRDYQVALTRKAQS